MLIDLRNLKKRLELDAEIERSSALATSVVAESAIKTIEVSKRTRTSEAVSGISKSKAGLILALVAIVAVVAGVIGINAWRGKRNTPVVSPPTTITPTAEPRLTYWITVQKFKDGKPYQDPFDLAGEINFEANYQIRLSI